MGGNPLRQIAHSRTGHGLLAIVDREIERLLKLEAERAAVADFLEEVQSNLPSDGEIKTLAPDSAAIAPSAPPTGAAEHRHRLRGRHDALRRKRVGEGAAGSENDVRALARRGIMSDLRFVVDERGDVRDAQGYDGDLAAGLARFKAEHGAQPREKAYYREGGAGGGNYSGGSVSGVGAKPVHWQSQGHAEAVTALACEAGEGNGNAHEAQGATRAYRVLEDCARDQGAAAGAAERRGMGPRIWCRLG